MSIFWKHKRKIVCLCSRSTILHLAYLALCTCCDCDYFEYAIVNLLEINLATK